MDKRAFILGGLTLPFVGVATAAAAKLKGRVVTWTVPKDVTRIRVRSWGADGQKNIDRKLDVEPGERFEIETL